MSNSRATDEPSFYEIQVKGCVDPKWADWFDGFAIRPCTSQKSILLGSVPDQAALHGLLAKIRDLGLPLLLVKRVDTIDDGRIS